MMTIFRNRHLEYLEAELERVRKDSFERLAELKSAHVEELNRVIDENRILRDENERLRLALIPAKESKDRIPETEADSSPQPTEESISLEQMFAGGSSWQRVQAREISKQLASETARRVRALEPTQAKLENPDALRRAGKPEERSQ